MYKKSNDKNKTIKANETANAVNAEFSAEDKRLLSRYAVNFSDKEVFEKKLNEGYTGLAAISQGPWIAYKPKNASIWDERIVALFAFYKEKGKIATLEFRKLNISNETMRCSPIEEVYTEKKFEKLTAKYQLDVPQNKLALESVVKNWGTW
jgi:hypothetical protein